VLPSGSLVVFARSDDFFLGVLESRFHKLWASETHNPLENCPRYRIRHSFESFPFPPGMTPEIPVADLMANPLAVTIADEARALYVAREAALTSGLQPLDMTEFYDRCGQGGAAWLATAHRQLDIAVAAAYGWSPDGRVGENEPGHRDRGPDAQTDHERARRSSGGRGGADTVGRTRPKRRTDRRTGLRGTLSSATGRPIGRGSTGQPSRPTRLRRPRWPQAASN
jgi:hypothetical protein